MANPPPIKPAAIAAFRAILRRKCERGGIPIIPSSCAITPATLLLNAIRLSVTLNLMLSTGEQDAEDRYEYRPCRPQERLRQIVPFCRCSSSVWKRARD